MLDLFSSNIITVLGANSSINKLIFLLFFLENRIWHFMQIVFLGHNFMQIVFLGHNLREVSNLFSRKNKIKYFKMSSHHENMPI